MQNTWQVLQKNNVRYFVAAVNGEFEDQLYFNIDSSILVMKCK